MFTLIGITLVLGIVAGLLAGGRLARLRDLRLRAVPLLFVSLAAGLVPLFTELARAPRVTLLIASLLGVLVFIVWNAREAHGWVRGGFLVVALGWALNFIVIAANAGMPLSLWAWSFSEQPGAPTPGRGDFFKVVIAGPDTWFRPLGDVIPIVPLRQVVSIGDLVLMAGLAIVLAAAMRGAGRPERSGADA